MGNGYQGVGPHSFLTAQPGGNHWQHEARVKGSKRNSCGQGSTTPGPVSYLEVTKCVHEATACESGQPSQWGPKTTMYNKIAGIKSEKLLGESPAWMQLDVSTKATYVAEGGPRAPAQGTVSKTKTAPEKIRKNTQSSTREGRPRHDMT